MKLESTILTLLFGFAASHSHHGHHNHSDHGHGHHHHGNHTHKHTSHSSVFAKKLISQYGTQDQLPLTSLFKIYEDTGISKKVHIHGPGCKHKHAHLVISDIMPAHKHHDHDHDHGHDHHDHDHEGHDHEGHDHHNHDHHHEDSHQHQNISQCLFPDALLSLHNISSETLSESQVKEITPALLFMSATKACSNYTVKNGSLVSVESLTSEKKQEAISKEVSRNKLPIGLVWLYSTLSITIITVFAALGLLLVPFLIKSPVWGDVVMTFLISSAVGVLVADALLHLIPDVLSDHSHHGHSHDDHEHGHDHSKTIWVSSVIMAGVYFFWIFEKFLHSRIHGHDHSHDHSHGHSHGYMEKKKLDEREAKTNDGTKKVVLLQLLYF
jgi:hypothetical protein